MIKNPFAGRAVTGTSFLPADYVARKSEMRASLICLTLFGVVLFGVIGAFFVTNRQWLHVREEQRTISAQYQQEAQKIDQLKKLEEQKASMMDKASITTALIEKVPRSILLGELVTRMPEDITILEMQLLSKRIQEQPPAPAEGTGPKVKSLAGTEPGPGAAGPVGKKGSVTKVSAEPERIRPPKFTFSLRIVGVARKNEDVADYVTGLKQCILLDNVDLKSIKQTEIDKVELRKFEIEAVLKPDADGRGIEPVKELRARARQEQPPQPQPPPSMGVTPHVAPTPAPGPRPEKSVSAAGDEESKP